MNLEVGQKLRAWAGSGEGMTTQDLRQPFLAHVLFVNPDDSVNLQVVDHAGNSFVRSGVKVTSPHKDDQHSTSGAVGVYATMMPYQVVSTPGAQPSAVKLAASGAFGKPPA